MKLSTTTGGLVLAALARSTLAGGIYTLSDCIVGEDFYHAFNFEAIPDPTDGRVNYVNGTTARKLNYDGIRFEFVLTNNTPLTSQFDMPHMPQGCGTWPAVWETNETNWPNGGEVDIVEGVNNVEPNQSTLHTGPNCSIPASGVYQLGTTVSTDCYAEVNGNQGCAVKLTEDNNSFGPRFNNIGGGWYAMERTDSYISIWFWERDDPLAPLDAISGAPIIDTSAWRTPAAYFPNTDCDLATNFDANNIIINLTFCGDLAGNSTVYAASGCPSICVDYVNKNPKAFTNAYFQFTSINIYE